MWITRNSLPDMGMRESDRDPVTGLFPIRTEYAKRSPERASARRAVQGALRTGVLTVPRHCERCRRRYTIYRRLSAHHADYSRPLSVEWLCRPCHDIRDRECKDMGDKHLALPPSSDTSPDAYAAAVAHAEREVRGANAMQHNDFGIATSRDT